MKRQPTERENICKESDWQGINLQYIQTAHAAQHQKCKQPTQKKKKMVEDLNRYLYVRDRLKQIKWQQQQKKLWTYFNLKLYVVFSIC